MPAGATTEVASPGADPRQRRRRIPGTTTERLPVRACSGDDLGRHVQIRTVTEPRRQSARARAAAEIEPSALQLTRRGRMLLTTVSVLVFGAAIAVLGLRIAGVLDPQPQFDHIVQVEVGAGQTLWSIAQETNPTEDPTLIVEQIADLNNLNTRADVVPGQTLQVPVR
ncbi:hypothetical protein GCM10009789_31920 [Kribbella sancticallisti]|uniref:LysM domain-containing protein n=1 Tax=Kribbella sancticallisti TaxID=460087 RepID=A0ABN2DFC3_9ACTN